MSRSLEEELIAFVRDFETWFHKWDDEADDCGFMNGDSDKYKGEDGQEQLAELGKQARDLLLKQLAASGL